MNIDLLVRPYREDPTWDEIRIRLDREYVGHVILPRRATSKEKADAVHRFVENYKKATNGR